METEEASKAEVERLSTLVYWRRERWWGCAVPCGVRGGARGGGIKMRALGSAEQVGAASVVGWASEGETHGAEAAELQSSAEPRPHAGGREMRSGEI